MPRSRLLITCTLLACGSSSPEAGPAGPAATAPTASTSVTPTPPGPPPSDRPDAAPAAPATAGCVTSVASGHHVFSCDEVTYDVEVSPACAAGGCGVIVDVHGMTMDADQQDKSTGLRARGAARGYVVVQPTASKGLLGPSWKPGTDDDKVWDFVTDARKALVIDARRVHVTGFSQGGGMTFRLMQKHADAIASGAAAAAADDTTFAGTDVPSRPVSLLVMNGTLDPLAPIAKARAQQDRIKTWFGSATTSELSKDDKHVRTRYQNTSNGRVLEVVEHGYAVPPAPGLPVPTAIAGHCFPGSSDLTRTPQRALVYGCEPPNAFVWGEIVIDFFVKNPMP